MNIHDIYSGTVMGSFPDDLRSGQEKRRERRKARQVEKDSTEIHVLGVSSDKCSPVKSRGGMKDHLIRTWLFTRSLLEEATRILNLYVKGSRRELEERLKERAYRELKLVPNDFRSGRERRRERRKQERKARWLEYRN